VENYALTRGAPPPAFPSKPVPAEDGPAPRALEERERDILAFERHWWRHAGAKEEAIRRRFGIGPTAYYQLLSRLIDDPAALAHDPMLVKRLQRQRAARRRQRASRRLGVQGPTGGS
jgi:Protein of unknown function (DUF3263)